MSLRLEHELKDLKDRLGIGVGDLTPDELEKFVLACRRIDNPYEDANLDLMERPFMVCRGVYGWRMTAGAHIWLEEYALKWWKRGSAMYRWAQAYAMLHAKEPDAFTSMTSRGEARTALLRTALRLVCHQKELKHALLKSYGDDRDIVPKPEDPNAKIRAKQDFAALVARLEVASGIPAKSWLWGRSFMSMMKSYAELHEFAAAFSMGGEAKRQSMLDELNDAVNDLARVKLAIYRRVKHEQGN